MIYEIVDREQPIRQGDIFKSLPHIEFDPINLLKVAEDGVNPTTWMEEINNEDVRVITRVESSYGIVITQDCDTVRDTTISFCKIGKLPDIVPDFKNVPNKKPENLLKWWNDLLIRKTRSEQKWFYLPPDDRLGFTEKMAADFQALITVRRGFLEQNKHLRIGRLFSEADEHFREHIAQYFRRYPYNEWYPMNKEEFESYTSDPSRKGIKPYPWQE